MYLCSSDRSSHTVRFGVESGSNKRVGAAADGKTKFNSVNPPERVACLWNSRTNETAHFEPQCTASCCVKKWRRNQRFADRAACGKVLVETLLKIGLSAKRCLRLDFQRNAA